MHSQDREVAAETPMYSVDMRIPVQWRKAFRLAASRADGAVLMRPGTESVNYFQCGRAGDKRDERWKKVSAGATPVKRASRKTRAAEAPQVAEKQQEGRKGRQVTQGRQSPWNWKRGESGIKIWRGLWWLSRSSVMLLRGTEIFFGKRNVSPQIRRRCQREVHQEKGGFQASIPLGLIVRYGRG